MKIKDIALSAAAIGERVVKAIAIGAVEVWSAVKYIIFKDPAVEQICVANFSSDGVGVTEEDAAKVTDIGTIFKGNTEITSFEEFGEFGQMQTIPKEAFNGCTSLQRIDIPESVISIGQSAYANCPNLYIERLNVPNCTNIGRSAFNGVRIREVGNIWGNPKLYNGTYEPYYLQEIFDNNDAITELEIPRGVFTIYGFKNCPNLTKVSRLPYSITILGIEKTFEGSPLNENFVVEMPNNSSGELPYATNITKFPNIGKPSTLRDYAYPRTSVIQIAVIPYSVTKMGASFGNCDVRTVVIHPTVPFTIHGFQGFNKVKIYVHDESLEAFKTANVWSNWASKIYPMSDYITFTDITSSLASDIVYNTALDVYAQFDATPITESGAKSMIYDLDVSYDTLKITGNGGTTSRLYCFIDENNEVITTADASLTAAPLYICIPSMARKMVICCAVSSTNVKVEIGKPK